MKHHESIHGERVAIAWHSLWALLCLSDVAACCFVFAQVMPWYRAGLPVAWLLWTLAGQGFAAACGAVWHVVAAWEHRREIARIGRVYTFHYNPALHKVDEKAILDVVRRGFQRGGIIPNTKENKT